jgi:hypothetical protein
MKIEVKRNRYIMVLRVDRRSYKIIQQTRTGCWLTASVSKSFPVQITFNKIFKVHRKFLGNIIFLSTTINLLPININSAHSCICTAD